jgi:hypothetical protein
LTLPVDDGTNGQVLTTDGSGILTWSSPAGTPSSIVNGNSNVVVNANANVTISSAGNANIVVVTGTGANIAGTANISGNANVGNLGTATAIITTGNISTINSGLMRNGNSNVTINANANVTISSNGQSNIVTVSSDATNGLVAVTGNLSANNITTGGSSGNITGANVISANTFQTIADGTVNFLGNNGSTVQQVTLKASNAAGFTSNYALTLPVDDGTSGQVLATDGSGILSWSTVSTSSLVNGNSNVVVNANANVTISSAGNANIVVVTGTGANVTGTLNVSANANTGNLGTATAIITTGNITTVNTGLVQNGNSNVAITANANITLTSRSNAVMVITGTGANITGTANVTSDILAGGNVNVTANINGTTFQNGNSNVAIAANANVSIASNGVANVVTITNGNLITGNGIGVVLTSNNGTDIRQVQLKTSTDAAFLSNYSLTLPVNDGASGQSLVTDGSGILSWESISTSTISNGNSNVSIPVANGNVNISSAGNANVFIVTGLGAIVNGAANITNTLTAPQGIFTNGDANLPFAEFSKVQITLGNLGTSRNQYIHTRHGTTAANNAIDFLTNDGNASGEFPANSILGLSISNGKIGVNNLTPTYTLDVTGNANISGNANIGNVGTTSIIANTVQTTANGNVVILSNNGTTTQQVTLQTSTDVLFTANYTLTLPVNDGSSGQYLQTDGSGILSWSSISTSSLINGNSNVVVEANANVTISSAGNANVLVVTGTGANITGTGNFSANLSAANLVTTGNVYAEAVVNTTGGTAITMGNGSGIIGITSSSNTTQFGPSGQIILGGASQIVGGTFGGSGITLGGSQTDIFQNRGGNVTVQVGSGGTISNTWTFAQDGSFTSPGNINASRLQNGNSNVTITANANITLTAKSNATMIITDTGANVTGTANITSDLITGGNLTVNGTGVSTISGNINMNGKWVGNIGYAVANTDAASKQYVDEKVSSGITYHDAVNAATTTTLAVATTGTTAYNEPNGSGNGIGSYISTTGTFTTIDGVTINGSTSIRILVKDEANAAWNGIYNYTNATAITRTTDTDTYGPNPEELSINDYFFTLAGTVNAGTAFIVDAPNGTITFGTSLIQFAVFSTSQVYTGGTGITVSGTVISANASQTQVTQVGTLISLDVTGNTTSGNFIGIFANGNSNVNIPTANGNVNISAVGNANVLVVTGTGANITGTGNFSGNLSAANLIGTLASGNSNVAITANGNITLTATSNSTMVITATGANITGTANITGDILAGANVNVTANINGATFQNGNSNVRIGANANLTISSNGQSNIVTVSSDSTNGLLTVDGNLTAGNIITSGSGGNITGANVISANTFQTTTNGDVVFVSNNGTSLQQVTLQSSTDAGFVANYTLTLPTTDGSAGQSLTTDGSGILSWTTISSSNLANGNSNIVINANANIAISSAGNANVAVFTGTDTVLGSNVVVGAVNANSGIIFNANTFQTKLFASNATVANYSLYLPANVASTNGLSLVANTDGTLSFASVFTPQATIKFTAATTGNNQTFTDANIANFGNVTAFSSVYRNGVLVDSANYAFSDTTLTMNVQLVSGDTITIASTNMASASSGGVAGGSNTQVQFNDAGAFGGDSGFTYNKTTDLLTIGNLAYGGANGNITVAGNTWSFGNLAGIPTLSLAQGGGNTYITAPPSNNITILTQNGGAAAGWSGIQLIDQGSVWIYTQNQTKNWEFANTGTLNAPGNINAPALVNGNSSISITSNANITLTSASNATMVITATGANITGTANISGNLVAANLNATTGIYVNSKQAVNGPAFSAYANATTQTITSGTQQKVLFQTEEYDTNNNYASSTFTPTVEGYYQLNAQVRLDGASGTGEIMLVIYKNGTEYKRGTNQQGTQIAANFWAMTVNSLVYANGSTDYFEIYVQQTSGSSVTVTAVNATNITWFNGCMVRGA